MKIDRELKQEINKAWQSAFPQLTQVQYNRTLVYIFVT